PRPQLANCPRQPAQQVYQGGQRIGRLLCRRLPRPRKCRPAMGTALRGQPRSHGHQAGDIVGPDQLASARRTTVQRGGPAAVTVGQAGCGVAVEEVGDDVAVAAHLHDVLEGIIERFHGGHAFRSGPPAPAGAGGPFQVENTPPESFYARFTYTVFTSVYSSRAYSPSSRPKPLILKPPNGAAASKTS